MARFRVTSPDGRAFVITAPDGATPEQVKAYAQQQFAAAPKPPTAPTEAPADPREGMGAVESALVRAGRGAQDTFQGLQQLVGEGLTARRAPDVAGLVSGDQPGLVERGLATALDAMPLSREARALAQRAGFGKSELDQFTRDKTAELALYERNNPNQNGIDWWRLAGNAGSLPLPGLGGASIAGRTAGAALTGAVAGGSQFVPEGGSRGQNAAIGGGTGLLAQLGLGEPLRAVSGKLAALVNGGKANVAPAAADALNYAAKNELPLYFDDVTKSPAARAAGSITDEIPWFGSGKSREVQAAAAEKHARDVVGGFQTGSGGRAGDVLRESAQAQLERARGIKNKLYTDAFSALNQAGEIDAPKMRAVATQIAQQEAARGSLADQGLLKQLADFAGAPKFNFESWHQARAQLGDLIKSGRSGENAVLGSRATSALGTVKRALDSDLNDAATQMGGDGGKLWKRADSFYREQMPKYKRGVVADLLRSNNPDAIAERILGGSDREGIARSVYGALTKDGRAEVRAALMQKALAGAISTDRPFSPARFAGELDKMGNRVGVFFKPADKKMLEGVANYMEHVKRAGQYMENPPTGKRGAQALGAVAALSNPALAMKALTGSAAITQLFRSRPGRDLLLRLGSVSPHSAAAQHYAQQLNGLLTRTAADQATQPKTNRRRPMPIDAATRLRMQTRPQG